jgi:hypothetical protein
MKTPSSLLLICLEKPPERMISLYLNLLRGKNYGEGNISWRAGRPGKINHGLLFLPMDGGKSPDQSATFLRVITV